jgi:hypothetical protein
MLVFILSYNGKTFKDRKLKEFILENNIEWKYNVEKAHGGEVSSKDLYSQLRDH